MRIRELRGRNQGHVDVVRRKDQERERESSGSDKHWSALTAAVYG